MLNKLKKFLIPTYILIILFVGFFIYQNNTKKQTSDSQKPKVAVSIFPIYDIAKNIAGNNIDVNLILPVGASPHTYEPKPSDIISVQGAVAVFEVGHGLDSWISEITKELGISTIITVDKNVKLKEYAEFEKINNSLEADHNEAEHADEHEEDVENHSHEGIDPHYYLSIKNAKAIANQISSELQILFPEFKDEILENEKNYVAELNTLEEQINSQKTKFQAEKIATFHNAWNYFAEELGINIVTTFEEYPGEEPTANYIKNFAEKITENNIKTVFKEPQFSPKALEPIAKDLGVTISELDPIGGLPPQDNFISLMRYNLDSIEKSITIK